MHSREAARVDYYETVTGTGRVEQHEDVRTGETVRVLRVERLDRMLTCRTCWASPRVQALLKEARRTGHVPPSPKQVGNT